MNVLVTGGAGFIGSNFLHYSITRYPEHYFINLDKLTYAANLQNLQPLDGMPNYSFRQADLADYECVRAVFIEYQPGLVVHFAAESHVDRSIIKPADFVQSNIVGTFNLLEACRHYWPSFSGKLFHHISTDEVYGTLGKTGSFTENTGYNPSSPYSASKAASDHLVRAYHRTYGLPVKITSCSNNYGPYQFPEKLIPLMILNALEKKPLPVYGRGENIRDWLFVEDHCRAIWSVIAKGKTGQTYNIGGGNQCRNIDIIHRICAVLSEETGRHQSEYTSLISFVKDRPGHDFRYAVDCGKIRRELGWRPAESFESGLRKTIRWYLRNQAWVDSVRTGQCWRHVEKKCGDRENSAPP